MLSLLTNTNRIQLFYNVNKRVEKSTYMCYNI